MDAIKAQVRALKADQLVELQTYIKGLLASGASPGRGAAAGVEAGLLLAVFEESCRKFGLGFVHPRVKQQVRNGELAIIFFLDRACPGSAPVVRRTILATGLDLLYDDLQANGRVVNPRSLAYGLVRLPTLLDRSFPGYAMCGHLARIVRTAA